MCFCVADVLQDDHVAESLLCVSAVADEGDHVAESQLCVSLCGRCTTG